MEGKLITLASLEVLMISIDLPLSFFFAGVSFMLAAIVCYQLFTEPKTT